MDFNIENVNIHVHDNPHLLQLFNPFLHKLVMETLRIHDEHFVNIVMDHIIHKRPGIGNHRDIFHPLPYRILIQKGDAH